MSTRHLWLLPSEATLTQSMLQSQSVGPVPQPWGTTCSSAPSALVSQSSLSRRRTQFWPCCQTKVWFLVLISPLLCGANQGLDPIQLSPSPLSPTRSESFFQRCIPFAPLECYLYSVCAYCTPLAVRVLTIKDGYTTFQLNDHFKIFRILYIG